MTAGRAWRDGGIEGGREGGRQAGRQEGFWGVVGRGRDLCVAEYPDPTDALCIYNVWCEIQCIVHVQCTPSVGAAKVFFFLFAVQVCMCNVLPPAAL